MTGRGFLLLAAGVAVLATPVALTAGPAAGAASAPLAAASQPVPSSAILPIPPSAILIDGRTGAVLFEQDADVRRPPASTTKVMTAILAIERLPPDRLVSISPRAAAQRSGSAIGLEVGERWRVDDLFHALMIASANDAAVALAEAVAGSVERFGDLMNQKARALGAEHSTFVVPHGLHHPRHQTTARDLARITRYALRHPAFAAIVRQQTYTLVRHGQPPRLFINRNRLLWRLPGADGVKTGWVSESGPCVVASATRSGWQLITVVLGSGDLFGDAARLLEYGFAHFRLVRVAGRDQELARHRLARADREVAATVAEDLYVVLRRGAALRWEVRWRPDLLPPILRGDPVGEMLVYADDRVVARQPVVAAADVQARSFWSRFVIWARGW